MQVRKFYERKSVIISLPINLNVCFVCSKEPSFDSSFGTHNICFGREMKRIVFQYALLLGGLTL